jgi:hypothetical protein
MNRKRTATPIQTGPPPIQPRPLRVLEGVLRVHEVPAGPSATRMRLAGGTLPDGTRYGVSADVGGQSSIYLERTGHPARVVYLHDLVAGMFAATAPEG